MAFPFVLDGLADGFRFNGRPRGFKYEPFAAFNQPGFDPPGHDRRHFPSANFSGLKTPVNLIIYPYSSGVANIGWQSRLPSIPDYGSTHVLIFAHDGRQSRAFLTAHKGSRLLENIAFALKPCNFELRRSGVPAERR